MRTRAEQKRAAFQVLKKHYAVLMLVCLVSAFLGGEFMSSMQTMRLRVTDQLEETETNHPRLAAFYHVLGLWDEGDAEGSIEDAESLIESMQEESGHTILGRSQGVFALVANELASGHILVTVFNKLFSIYPSRGFVRGILLGGCGLVLLLFWFFITQMTVPVTRRMILEGRCYEKLPFDRYFYFLHVGKWLHVAWVVLLHRLLQIVSALTVVGGVLYRYAFFLVPYLMAENPSLSAKDAFSLSRQMMRGHKLDCFLMEASFWIWAIPSVLTFGLSDLLFVNPFKICAYCEFYVDVREAALQAEIPGTENLNDFCLYAPAASEQLQTQYADVAERLAEVQIVTLRQNRITRFLADGFGITLKSGKEELAYEQAAEDAAVLEAERSQLLQKAYPARLSPIPQRPKRAALLQVDYRSHYSVTSLILLFFASSMFGWLWEVGLHFIQSGSFVNRGSLHGPWVPIYGAGAVLIVTLLYRLRAKPVAEVIGAMALAGVVEYTTSYVMEQANGGLRWWDYSGYFLNLDGRICAEGLLIFGVGAVLAVYLAAPVLEKQLRKLPRKALICVCAMLLAVFIADIAYSGSHPNTGEGITVAAAVEETVVSS